ncbi:HEXXH motif domain-containing protein [Streptomyces sp. B8F3]|uniref:HEXXH motif domain-containing protein n=1 Tax=unclassified Streptomyces TaxID=2593676 RepID=UPI00325F0E36
MTRTLTRGLTTAQIRQLGRADGDDETLAVLVAAQQTKRLLLLRMLFDVMPAAPPPAAALAARHADLIETAEQHAAGAVRDVLQYPLVGPWLEHCINHLKNGPEDEAVRDLAHLGGIATATAARAGLSFTTAATVHGAHLALPTVGLFRLSVPDGSAVDIAGEDGVLVLTGAGERPVEVCRDDAGDWHSGDPRWLPLRSLDGGPRPVALDDLHPNLDLGALPVRGAVGGQASYERWHQLWEGALPLLRGTGRDRFTALSLLSCIVPLGSATEEPGRARYAGTSEQGFGAVLMMTPSNAVGLAQGLTHELQHAKLGALSELMPLHAMDADNRYWAPWRPDPRPYDGLLHGVYAHLDLSGFWHRVALSTDDDAVRNEAWSKYAECWTMNDAVLSDIRDNSTLTDAGRVFIQSLVERHEQLGGVGAPEKNLTQAAKDISDLRAEWLGRNGR